MTKVTQISGKFIEIWISKTVWQRSLIIFIGVQWSKLTAKEDLSFTGFSSFYPPAASIYLEYTTSLQLWCILTLQIA